MISLIQSLVRSLDLLEVLKGAQKNFSIAELSSELDLPPSTVHRILKTLCEKNFVLKDESSHTYKLGPALISLGMAASNSLHLRDSVTPILKELSSETSEDAFFMIAVGYNGIVIDKVDSINKLKVVDQYGYEYNLHCGAIRKTLLAHQTDDFIENYIRIMEEDKRCYPKLDSIKLREDLIKIRKEGIAVSYGEYIEGAVGVGAPVFEGNGTLKGSIGIIAPASRIFDGDKIDDIKTSVKKYAEKLSYHMGYTGTKKYSL